MAKGSNLDDLARDAAQRIDQARAAGEQLTFLPDEPAPGDSDRAKRGKGKATSQLREFLAARGLRMPEDVLIEMAGMASTDDAFVTAMARTEQLLAWAEAGATGYKGSPAAPSMAQRLAAFQFVYTAQLRSLEAVMPYVAAKVTPDVAVTMPVQIVQMPAPQAARPGDLARDVTQAERRIGPPPLPHRMQQNQGVSGSDAAHSDGAIRTGEVTR